MSSFTHPLELVPSAIRVPYTCSPLDFVHLSRSWSSLHSSFGFRSFFSWSLFTYVGAPYIRPLDFLLEFVHLELLTRVLWISFHFPLEFVHLCRSSVHSSFEFRSLLSWSSFTWSSLHLSFGFQSLFLRVRSFVPKELLTLIPWSSITCFLELLTLIP